MANYISNHGVTKLDVTAIRKLKRDDGKDRWYRELVIKSIDGDLELTLFADDYGQLIFDFEPEE